MPQAPQSSLLKPPRTAVVYDVKPINIGKGEQKTPKYTKLNPNIKIPNLVAQDSGRARIESGTCACKADLRG